ncbi:PEP-CTERM sorting domain-containing protein [Psychrosphaera sp. B3R10]|uniref:PEP-CTERM sorting domain-containing protein n=1 Tax=unclassified Psychrosphaera TaxID=2641570 RepID=UPI001C08222D|nr:MULTISPECIES: PEP-CTERM sorting domain-containing protein [unclassified Psychrosphaera]MBU2882728.1 PEP-CTERM sorting domain-containing protein [Psychrosphaera sp. I2R16]MBU2989254.1 PEP-CTERM sorting domain-containing protein [Psychrosphaera sp. B3R10]
MKNKHFKSILVGATLAMSSFANAGLMYDANVTNNAIFGSGNLNGSFTVMQEDGIELGLRGKLRHNASGSAENTFNSNGDGTYSFDAGVAPTQSAPTAVWSFEWSINSDFDGSTGNHLDDYLFELVVDYDAGGGVAYRTYDLFDGYYDHSIGTNATAQGAGDEAAYLDVAGFQTLAANNNLAQNSWKAHWFFGPSFDPTVDGTYDISLRASSNGQIVTMNTIQIIVGNGAIEAPEPSTLAFFAMGLVALASRQFGKKNIV